jgi:hypothetical protein
MWIDKDPEVLEYKGLVKNRHYSNEQIAKVIELWRSGLNQTEIQVITGTPFMSLTHWVSKHYFGYKGDNPVTITLKSKV